MDRLAVGGIGVAGARNTNQEVDFFVRFQVGLIVQDLTFFLHMVFAPHRPGHVSSG